MATEKLFYKDSFTKEFTAWVVSCEPVDKGFKLVLDQTAFFPEGGGQTADTGVLIPEKTGTEISEQKIMLFQESAEQESGIQESAGQESGIQKSAGQENVLWKFGAQIQVLDVQEENEIIYHITDKPLEAGTRVKGRLNWEERFLKMQHHSGEHIVSGLVNRHFKYNNVGFHLGSQVVTLDFDGMLTKEELRMIERKANEAVAENIPIEVSYPSREELSELQYRSKIEIEGQVRIITIPGYDVCACCAPHMKTTGQIGMIKLINMHHYKGGVRVYMLCGFAALADYCEKEDSVRAISLSLSTHESQVAEGVERLKEEIYSQKGEILRLQNELLSCKAASIAPGTEKAVVFDENLEGNQAREMVNRLLEKEVGLAAVFAGNDEKGYRYVIGSRSLDVRELVKQLNQALNGRGGGRKEMVQGSVSCTREEAEQFFRQLDNQ